MRRPSIAQGILVALVLAFAAGLTAAALASLVMPGVLVYVLVPGVSFCYLVYLLCAAGPGTGRVTALAFWSVLAIASGWLAPPLPVYVLIHTGAIWLVRALYFHTRPLAALLDVVLSVLAACALLWSSANTGSVFLATWFFFLVQAFFVVIPNRIGTRNRRATRCGNAAFEHARRRADVAIRTMARSA